MTDSRLASQLAFILELDRLKRVLRRTSLVGGDRRENSAEHSWQLAVMAMVLGEYANAPIDLLHTLKLLLVHDIVEIDAGDTFAYDDGDHLASKEAREQAAADRLYGMLPTATGSHLRQLWDEYERGNTAEARFVMAVDRMAPMLLNLAEGGTTWREHGITPERVEARNGEHIAPALPEVWAHAKALLDRWPG